MAKATTSATGQGRTYGGQSSGERRAERQERLIRAAVDTYGEQGYRRTTVADVCRAAGLTPRYFYESFANSEALLIAAYEAVTRIALETVQAAASGLGETEREARLEAMLRGYYTLLREKPAAARVFVTEMSGTRTWIAHGCNEPVAEVVAIAKPFCRILVSQDA